MHPFSSANTHHDVTDLLNRGMAKNTTFSSANTHHDVTDLLNRGMAKNTKTLVLENGT